MFASDTCDIFEALALDPRDHRETSTPEIRCSDDDGTNPFLDKYDEFILEADHTARVASIAKAVSKAVIQNWNIARRAAPTTCINPKAHEIFETKPISSRPNPKSEPKRRQKSFIKKSRFSGDFSSTDLKLSHTLQRWNLKDITTTMTDFILSNKTFNREAYEQSQKKEKERQKEKERERAKIERANIISSVGLIGGHESSRGEKDPLRQNGFTSSTRELSGTTRARSIILTPPTTPEPQENSRKNSACSSVSFTKPSANGMEHDRLLYPSPLRIRSPSLPQKDKARLTPPYDHPLPKLPDSPPTVLLRQSIKRKPLNDRPLPKAPSSPPVIHFQPKTKKSSPGLSIPVIKATPTGTINLPSTKFTLNSPQFCHGPIRIERGQQQCFSPEDESLDWMAFQISIIGVLDEHENGKDDVFRKGGDAELDELASWFSDFGLAVGSMEREGPDGWIKAYI